MNKDVRESEDGCSCNCENVLVLAVDLVKFMTLVIVVAYVVAVVDVRCASVQV